MFTRSTPRYATALILAPLVAGLLCVASGQAPAQPRGVLALLSPDMPVSHAVTGLAGGSWAIRAMLSSGGKTTTN